MSVVANIASLLSQARTALDDPAAIEDEIYALRDTTRDTTSNRFDALCQRYAIENIDLAIHQLVDDHGRPRFRAVSPRPRVSRHTIGTSVLEQAATMFIDALGTINRKHLRLNLANVETNSDAMKALKYALARAEEISPTGPGPDCNPED